MLEEKRNEIKQKEYSGYPFYVVLTVLWSWKFNLSTILRIKCRGTYVYCVAGFLLTAVVLPVFGDGGAILLAAIFTLACLTTCVGLINSISQFFSILFKNFVEIYLESMEHRIKENALMTKQNIFYHHIVPYLGEMKLDEITPKDIIHWQDQVMKDNNYKQTYLKTIHNQLSALFNLNFAEFV